MAKKKSVVMDDMYMSDVVTTGQDYNPPEDAGPYKDVLIRVVKDIGHAPTCQSRNHEDESRCNCYLADARKLLSNA